MARNKRQMLLVQICFAFGRAKMSYLNIILIIILLKC